MISSDILPKALKWDPYQQHENVISVTLGEGEIVIILAEECSRQIARLFLPVTNVSFRIKNVAKKSKKHFLSNLTEHISVVGDKRIWDKLKFNAILSDICCKKDTI